MIKILAFLEADLPRVESEINPYMAKYDIKYIYHTGARLIFILKEKPSRSGGHRKSVETEES